MADQYEYGFAAEAEVPGIMFVTRNQLLAQTLQAGRPHAPLYRRPVPTQDWEVMVDDAG